MPRATSWARAEKITTNGFRAVVDIDLPGSFHCAKAVFTQLKRTQGALLFVSGGQAQMPFAYQSHVSAVKADVDQLMRTLALEWGPLGSRAAMKTRVRRAVPLECPRRSRSRVGCIASSGRACRGNVHTPAQAG